MTAALLPWVTGLLVVALLLAGWRLLRGPDALDRVIALDALYGIAIALIVVLGIAGGSTLVFEAALLVALLGFVGTVALARLLGRNEEDTGDEELRR